jgi:hypothetical protein
MVEFEALMFIQQNIGLMRTSEEFEAADVAEKAIRKQIPKPMHFNSNETLELKSAMNARHAEHSTIDSIWVKNTAWSADRR